MRSHDLAWSVRGRVPDAIYEITARQRGLITRRQALAAGVGDDALRHRVARGALRRVRSGLYAVNGLDLTREHAVLGAILLAGHPAWASHFTAARMWGFFDGAERSIELTIPLGRRVRLEGVSAHRSGTVAEHDVRTLAKVPVLSAARTIVDLSARLTIEALERMVDDGLRRRVLSLAALRAVSERLPTIAPGRSPQAIARVLRDRIAGYHPGDSELETRVHAVLVECGLPAPVRQCRVIANSRTYFIDLAYPDARVGIEVDGFEYHRERGAFDRDRKRQNDLVGAGWTIPQIHVSIPRIRRS